jgi:formylglycine-generating enzyme required for sulfatase activity
MMGSPPAEKGRTLTLEGYSPVTLSAGYWLSQCEITQAQWTKLMGTKPWKQVPEQRVGDDYPAIFISWEDAMDFCGKMTTEERRAGRLPDDWTYVLPSEQQWEYACRAGTATPYSFGADGSKLGDFAWYRTNTIAVGEDYAHVVGRKEPNPWGFHDMHGNAFEWCLDEESHRQKRLTPLQEQLLHENGPPRILRGGCWSFDADGCRSAFRASEWQTERSRYNGFRVVLLQQIAKK